MVRIIGIDLDMSINKQQKSIRDIVNHVSNNIFGRLANKFGDKELDNVDKLLEYIQIAGGGNHLEIGTLYGGSAIAVALLKNELDQDGMIVCIDPFDGYYSQPEDISGVSITPETIFLNIDEFDVGNRILVMQTCSQFVHYLDMQFNTAYIDGDHDNEVPLHDWLLVKDMVNRFVIFDNHSPQHPDVMKACKIANEDDEWACVYDKGITYVVERII